MKTHAFGGASQARVDTVHPILRAIMMEAIRTSPIDFGVPEFGGARTVDEQFKLFQDGVSKCDGVLKLSAHQSGLAIDIYAYVRGGASWDTRYLGIAVGHIMGTAKRMGYDMVWGGDFDKDWNLDEGDSWDSGHLELILP